MGMNRTENRTETVEITFFRYLPDYKKKSEDWSQNFYY